MVHLFYENVLFEDLDSHNARRSCTAIDQNRYGLFNRCRRPAFQIKSVRICKGQTSRAPADATKSRCRDLIHALWHNDRLTGITDCILCKSTIVGIIWAIGEIGTDHLGPEGYPRKGPSIDDDAAKITPHSISFHVEVRNHFVVGRVESDCEDTDEDMVRCRKRRDSLVVCDGQRKVALCD